jgi:hypothetical protein
MSRPLTLKELLKQSQIEPKSTEKFGLKMICRSALGLFEKVVIRLEVLANAIV